MKNTIIVSLFFLIISDAFCSDTIRINLSVNYKVISNPSKEIQLKFRTKKETVLSNWINDSMLYIPNLSDTSEIVLLYNNESNINNSELGSCFKYSPNGFSQI